MDTLHHTPIIASCDALVLGSTLASLVTAISLSQAGKSVAIASDQTHLYSDLCKAHRLWITEGEKQDTHAGQFSEETEITAEEIQRGTVQKEREDDVGSVDSFLNLVFPPSVQANNNKVLHPDKLKLHGEQLCEQFAIILFYGLMPVGKQEDLFLFGGKHGLVSLECKAFYDLRENRLPSNLDSYGYVMHVVNVPQDPDEKKFSLPNTSTTAQETVSCTLRKGTENGYAFLNVALPANTRNEEFVVKDIALACFSYLKNTVPGYRAILPGRFAEKPYPLSYSLKEEIRRGLMATPSCYKTSPKEELQYIPSMMSLLAHNPVFAMHTYPTTEPTIDIHRIVSFDLLVLGGGTSGCMAAIACARQGYRTALVEGNSQLGGTATTGGVGSYWYGRQRKDTSLVDSKIDEVYLALGIQREDGPWHRSDYSNPGFKEKVLGELCNDLGIQVFTDTSVFATARETNRVTGVLAGNGSENMLLLGKQVIDATGDADIAMFAGSSLQYGAQRDGVTLWASLAQYNSPERYRNNFSNTVVLGDPIDFTRFIRQARTLGEGMFDHGTYVAVRESRHIKAVRVITLQDILGFHRPEDTVATCFSNYDPKGKNSSDSVYAGFLPPPMSVAIPLSALIPLTQDRKVLKGLLVTGKAIGATHDASPGLRMQLDMMHLGFVAGLAASQAMQDGQEFTTLDIPALQQMITEQTGDSLSIATIKEPRADSLVASITDKHLKDWTHLPFDQEIAGPEPLLLALLAPSYEILYPLERRFSLEGNPKVKLTLAQLILWHRSDKATDYILEAIGEDLKQAGEDNLPTRKGSMMCVQLLPDHGVMAETVYLLNLLSWSKKRDIYKPFEMIVDRLLHNERDYCDNAKSIFNYMESIPYVAERTCLPEFIPLIKKVLGLPEIQVCMQTVHTNPMLRERHALLALSLFRALARLGDREGYEGLVALLTFDVLTIRRAALLELQALTGGAFPLDQKRWKAEIRSGSCYAPKPITERVW